MKTSWVDLAVVVIFLGASLVAWPIEHAPRLAISILVALALIALARSLSRLLK